MPAAFSLARLHSATQNGVVMADPSPPIHGAAFAGIALRVDPLILADTIECRRGDGVVVANMVLTGNGGFVLPRPGHEAHEAG